MEGLALVDVPQTRLLPDKGGRAQPSPQDETEEMILQQVLLNQMSEPLPGLPLSSEDLKREKLYFEAQAANSDTCGMNALNNLCQRPMFQLSDLQEAEAEHARAHEGGHFARTVPPKNLPTGFFDMEALKIAASKKAGLEIVDVEPVMDYRESACLAFYEAAATSADASWFLGYIVYDGRPGHPLHYYTLRFDERSPGVWIRLDSQLPPSKALEDCRNRRITSEELWASYRSNSRHFGAWVLRWYPVVYCKGAAEEVCRQIEKRSSGKFKVLEERALKALKECGWVVSRAVKHLVEDLPRTTVRELLVRFARPSEAEMRRVLEAANWDVVAAQPAIDQVLRDRIDLVQRIDAGDATSTALSLCDWIPHEAARLLCLQLQCKAGDDALSSLHEALNLAGNDVDHAEALLSLAPQVGCLSMAKALLAQTKNWSVKTAQQLLQVQKRFPRVSVAVASEVLRRNDDDPHAACEMLAEHEKEVQRLVLENADEDLFKGDEVAIAETALSTADWDPNVSFSAATKLTIAVQQTRKLVRTRGGTQAHGVFPIDAVLAALTAVEQRPQAAARILLGIPEDQQQQPAQSGQAPLYAPRALGSAQPQPQQVVRAPGGMQQQRADRRGVPNPSEDEDLCSVM